MKKITVVLMHLVLVLGLITILPTVKSPSNQVLAVVEIEEGSGGGGGPDDTTSKPSSGPKEESKDKETKSVVSTVWGWIKKLVS